MHGLRLGDWLAPGSLVVDCRDFGWIEAGPSCRRGRVRLPDSWLDLDEALEFSLQPEPSGGYRLALKHERLVVELHAAGTDDLRVVFEQMDLGLVAPLLAEIAGLSMIGGTLSGHGSQDQDGWRFALQIEQMFFDTPEGEMAGDGIGLNVDVVFDPALSDIRVDLEQAAGELLLGPIYLPPPQQPLQVQLELALDSPGRIGVTLLAVHDPGAFELSGSAVLTEDEHGWHPVAWRIDALEADFARLWPRWLDGPAAAAGFADMEAAGQLRGRVSWHHAGGLTVDLSARNLDLDDPRQRLWLGGASAHIEGSEQSMQIDLGWEGLGLLGLGLGAGQARFYHDEVGLRLLDPVRMGLLDGAVVIDGFAALRQPDVPTRIVLDARIEPLDLAGLTRALHLPELGGSLAGRFPGVTYSEERLTFTGGIEIEAFSGRISLDQLEIERPFGSAPALATEVEFQRLDLLELTGAFGFGRMEGQVSGWARGLRLVNWRPAAMDARLFTHEDVPRRRISQRAVDNLSNLGGGGSAIVSGTILRVFEDFPYRRVGLACRLANNICHIDGVAAHDSGGFLIVEGRGLPRLDIVGHRRLVDWPQLMGQLAGMVE